MKHPPCPAREQLSEYVHGRLDLTAHDTLEAHLDECPACLAEVETLDGEATSSFGRWRAAPDATPDDDAVRRLAARAKTIAPTAPPRVLGQYVLHELIGSGGMGQVYRAEHRLMKRTVAVKLLSPELFRSPEARARFRREVELAGRVRSPHVVAAHDAGESDGRDFLVMEYVEGRTLAEVVKADGPLPVARALECVRQAAVGLEHAHSLGIVHRDVKPSNLLLDSGGTVKLLDLGLARARLEANGRNDADVTGRHAVMGTAAYMAPEQAADVRRADARSDVYALGCTLFFLLTGKPPFEGATVMEVLFAHREKQLPDLRHLRPDCPADVEALVRRMTAKRPEQRPADMRAVVGELDGLLAGRSPRRRAAIEWLAVAAVLLVAVVLAGVFWHPAATPPTTGPDQNLAGRGPEPKTPDEKHPATRSDQPAAPEMVLVEKGEFTMGSPDSDLDADKAERPSHLVRINHPFYLGKFEVTQGEFVAVMERNPSQFAPDGKHQKKLTGVDTRRLPVEAVPWKDAILFCNRLSELQKLKPYYGFDGETVKILGGTGYRLPTEAEWEYACRAGSDTRWSFGGDAGKLGDFAWFADNSDGMPHPVGEKKPNKWGLYDMHGNVPEWVWDRFDENYYRKAQLNDPLGSGEGTTRVHRGGSWNDLARQTRSAARGSLGPAYGVTADVGIRVARDAEP